MHAKHNMPCDCMCMHPHVWVYMYVYMCVVLLLCKELIYCMHVHTRVSLVS